MMRYSLLIALFCTFTAGLASRDLLEATEFDRDHFKDCIAKVAKLHLLTPEFDAELVGEGLDRYISSLDPSKLFFTAADIQEFNSRKDELAKGLAEGDIHLVHDVYRLYQLRARDYCKEALRQLAANEFDFSIRESLVISSSARDWPTAGEDISERVRKVEKYRLLDMRFNDEVDLETAVRRRSIAYQRFLRKIEAAEVRTVNGYFLNSLFSVLDSSTQYYLPADAKKWYAGVRGSLFGIGAEMQANDEGLTVTSILRGGPAEKDGRLKVGDRIVEVGQGESGLRTDVRLLPMDDAVNLITGPDGTVVRLAVLSKDETEPAELKLTRGRVTPDTAETRGEVFTAGRGAGQRKVGFISVPSFYYDAEQETGSATDIREHLEDFAKKNVDVVVLDLRNNGGGVLGEVLRICGLFVTRGPVLQVQRKGSTRTYETEGDQMLWDKPVVVLVNRNTGSGAEIVAAAIQDYGRGLVVGDEVTFGMGALQDLSGTVDVGILSYSTNMLFRVNGDSIHRRGIQPDLVLPSLTGIHEPAEITGRLEFERIEPVARTNQEMLSPLILKSISDRSNARQSGVPEFAQLTNAAETLLRRARKIVAPLNEEDFFAEREANKLDLPPTPEPGERDFYLDEVLAIAAEYAFQLKGKTATATAAAAPVAEVSGLVEVPSQPPKRMSPEKIVAPATPPAESRIADAEQRRDRLAADQREIRLQILDAERELRNEKANLPGIEREIAWYEKEIAKNEQVMQNASILERAGIAAINIHHSNQKRDWMEKREALQAKIYYIEERLDRLKREQIRIRD